MFKIPSQCAHNNNEVYIIATAVLLQDNYGSILSGCQVPNELDAKTKLSLKSLMIRNIDQFGHVYHRFAITTVSKQ